MQSADREKVVSELCTRLNSAGPADAPVPFSEVSAPQEGLAILAPHKLRPGMHRLHFALLLP
jgi:hypothetical protein